MWCRGADAHDGGVGVPSWYALVLLALAAFRVWRLLALDSLLDRPRALIPDTEWWDALVYCPWCLGFWVSVVWWGGYELSPHWCLVVAAPFAVSAVVGVLGSRVAT